MRILFQMFQNLWRPNGHHDWKFSQNIFLVEKKNHQFFQRIKISSFPCGKEIMTEVRNAANWITHFCSFKIVTKIFSYSHSLSFHFWQKLVFSFLQSQNNVRSGQKFDSCSRLRASHFRMQKFLIYQLYNSFGRNLYFFTGKLNQLPPLSVKFPSFLAMMPCF